MKKSFLLFGVLIVLPLFVVAQESLPKINITLMSCTELQCTNQKDVFSVNESAYLDYNSTVKEISYSAAITFPDGTKYQTTFPNRITSNATGNYTVELIAWKEGYLDTSVSKVVQFVDNSSGTPVQNPMTINPVPVLAIIAAALIVFALWRYSKKKFTEKPKEEKAGTSQKKKR
jgi:hypothetical protein